MSKLVECKSCKKEVAKGAKVCPHCGQKNPTIKTKDMLIGFAVLTAIVTYMIMPDSPNSKDITKAEYGDKWAFTTDSATLLCYKDEVGVAPLVVIDGKKFGLTGYADNQYGQSDLNAIDTYWLKDEKKGKGVHKDLGVFMDEARKLCNN